MSLIRGPQRPRLRPRLRPLRLLVRPLAAGVLCACLLVARSASANSSFTARFDAPVAGPGVEQTALLLLHHFPGDGAAILEVGARVSPERAALVSASSTRGAASIQHGRLRLDYRGDPIGTRITDTVRVRLICHANTVPFTLELTTNTDSTSTAYRSTTILRSLPPLGVAATVAPEIFYPGETVEAVVRVTGTDTLGRAPEALNVDWPPGLAPLAEAVSRTTPAPESGLEYRRTLRVAHDAGPTLTVRASVVGGGLRASPVVLPDVLVRRLPAYSVASTGALLQGQPATLRLVWANTGARPLRLAGLEAVVAGGLAQTRLRRDAAGEDVARDGAAGAGDGAAGVRLEADEEKGSVRVRVSGPLQLAPGAEIIVVLATVPQVTGPLRIIGRAQPADRDAFVDLRGDDVIRITTAELPGTAPPLPRTDLEMILAALEPSVRQALADLPLPRGAGVALTADRSDDGNWVVEGLLTDLLRERGVRVLADTSAAAELPVSELPVSELHYRLADARVVYSPAGSAWNLFSDRRRRDARAEIYLRLVTEDRVGWARQVEGTAAEAHAPGSAAWLGGARGIDQADVAADHRALEFGLSGLITGGLFFVFFAP